jgi:hypothetical protein
MRGRVATAAPAEIGARVGLVTFHFNYIAKMEIE